MTKVAASSSSNNQKRSTQTKQSTLLAWADRELKDASLPVIWLHKVVRIALIVLSEIKNNYLSMRAGYLTYALLLSMVPMLAMSTAVVKGLGGGNQLREIVYTYIDSLERTNAAHSPEDSAAANQTSAADPPPETVDLTSHLRSAVDKIFDYVDRTNFATLGTFGMVGIFLSVILVLGQIEKAMNAIWKVTDGRSILRKITDYITMMVLMPISINVALAAGTMLESQALTAHVDRFLPMEWIQTLLLQGVPVLFLSITIYIVYIFFPNTKTSGIPTMIGAFAAGCLWFLTQNVYISMQIGVAKYNAIYGSFATIPLFLAWVWLGWLFVLIGAQLAYAIQQESGYRFVEKQVQPATQLSAALDICSTVNQRFSQKHGTQIDDICTAFPEYSRNLIEKTVDALIQADVLHHAEETGKLMVSRPPETITNQFIVEAVLGTDPPRTAGGRAASQAVSAAIQAFPADQPIGAPDTKEVSGLEEFKEPEPERPVA
jgi:membrane protein